MSKNTAPSKPEPGYDFIHMDDEMLHAAADAIADDLLAHATAHGLDMEGLLPSEQAEYDTAKAEAAEYVATAFGPTVYTVADLARRRLQDKGGSLRANETAAMLRLRQRVHQGEKIGTTTAYDFRTATLFIGPRHLRSAIMYVVDWADRTRPDAVAAVVVYIPPSGSVRDGGAEHPGFVNEATGEIVEPYTDEGKSGRNPSPLLRSYRIARLLTAAEREPYELGMQRAQDALWTMDRLAARADRRGLAPAPEADDDDYDF
jgi:hypothetical protein